MADGMFRCLEASKKWVFIDGEVRNPIIIEYYRPEDYDKYLESRKEFDDWNKIIKDKHSKSGNKGELLLWKVAVEKFKPQFVEDNGDDDWVPLKYKR